MDIRMKPLFPEGDETEPDRLDLVEATLLCEQEIQTNITAKRPYTTGDIVHALYCKWCKARKRSLPFEETARLARLHAERAGWRVRTLDLRDSTSVLHYPTEHAYLAWLRVNMPHALQIASRRPVKGRGGREDTTADVASFANDRKSDMTWKDICSAWKRTHPNDPRSGELTWKKVREAWRRHYGDKRRERRLTRLQQKVGY